MKKKKKFLGIILILLIIGIVGFFIYDKMTNVDYLRELKYNDLMEKIDNKETFVLCISQTECVHCQSYKPKLREVANQYKLEMFYIDVDLLDEEENKKIKEIANYSGTPTTIFFKDGQEESAAFRINGDASKTKIINKLKSNGFID